MDECRCSGAELIAWAEQAGGCHPQRKHPPMNDDAGDAALFLTTNFSAPA
jgi:hypothetical protein